MSLAEGQRLGPYEVLGRIGAGGMGEVYRAKDTRLDRTVALKVLRQERATPQLRARLEREARTISSLSHPHICTLFDVGQQDGQTFLVMEHIEGQTLSERLMSGALPLARSLDTAIQIAEALAAAHRQGVVHRDLKPGNVMLTKNGVKLLDFGLARLADGHATSAERSGPTAATDSEPLTGERTILGTLLYMAPEQIQGRPADARADLWALGLVIYEMLTGSRAFDGTSAASVIGAILEREPEPVGQLQPLTSPALERLVERCLAKSPDDRWDTAHDVAGELRWIAEAGGQAPAPDTRRRRSWLRALGLACVAATGLLVGLVVGGRNTASTAPPVVRSLLDVGPADELNGGGVFSVATLGGSRTALDWTPDGRALVFVGRRGGIQQLYVRDLGREEARPLAGTEGAQGPAVSRDGRWVAFWADRRISRIELAGGPTSILAPDVPFPPFGMAWGESGHLYYSHGYSGRVWRVEAESAPVPVTTLQDREFSHSMPQVLPGEKAIIYTVRRYPFTWADAEIVAQDLATGARKTLVRDAVDARYARSGHLLFLREGTLVAAAFDASTLTLGSAPTPVLEGIAQALTAGDTWDVTGAGQFTVAASGALAYLAGPVQPHSRRTLVALDRGGRVSPLPAPPLSSPTLSLAPDGRRLAARTKGIREQDLWIVDLSRGTLARLAQGPGISPAIWTPDGQRVVFGKWKDGLRELVWQRADGTSPAEPLLAPSFDNPSSWSPDGRHLAVVTGDDNIGILTLSGSTPTIERLTETPETEAWPEFSPDGEWLAYGSDATGRYEIYVVPWPGRSAPQQVSLDGGASPAWNPAGRELFFLSALGPSGGRRMWVVDVATNPRLRIGRPRALFDFSTNDLSLNCDPVRCYAVSPDGARFFAMQRQPQPVTPPVTHVRIVQGWVEEMKERVGQAAAR